MTKQDRIDKLNREIVALIIRANKLARRSGNWSEEEKLYAERDKLEKQIKQIEAEQ